MKKFLVLSVLLFPLSGFSFPKVDDLASYIDGENYRDFKAWSDSDYTTFVTDETKANFSQTVVDVNLDGKPDLIVDGVFKGIPMALGIVSLEDGYRVTKFESWNNYSVPCEMITELEGKSFKGLGYYKYINDDRNSISDPIVSFGYPQQTNSAGELLSDGESVELYFNERDGFYLEALML